MIGLWEGNQVNSYSMSGVGSCSRIIVATILGYEPLPESEDSKILLKHATRCEDLAAQQIIDEGYVLQTPEYCLTCQRYGHHIEIDTALFKLVGHLDRRIILGDGRTIPTEIKSLGRFTWDKFARENFGVYPEYVGQEACYLEAEKSPGIYWVMNRDTGKALRYIVNDTDHMLDFPGFERLVLPITFNQIVDKLNMVEIYVQDGILPEGEPSDACRYCKFKYLCITEEKEEAKEIQLPNLVEAAELYKEGKDLEKAGQERIEQSKYVLLNHAKEAKIDKYHVCNVSVSYRGAKTKKWLDEKLIRSMVSDEVIKQVERESKPYDDFTIRILKE